VPLSNVFENRVIRPVRVVTEQLTFDGLLNISLGARTLDELNLSARAFLTLSTPHLVVGSWELGDAPLIVNKSSVLCVLEIPEIGATLRRGEDDPELRRFARAAVRMRLRDYAVEGYVHTGPGGSALTRLNQSAHPFLALQSATVTGPHLDFGTPFLAINRTHVLSAQELFSVDAVPEEVAAGTGGADT